MSTKKIKTTLINAGRKLEFTRGSINPLIQRASSLIFDSLAHKKYAALKSNDSILFYGRKGTLTHFALQEAMMELEGGAGCALYPCGLAAISNAILSFVCAGSHILITSSAYEETQKFCNCILNKMNITTTWFDPLIGIKINEYIQENTQVIVLESPGSITMEIQDIPAIVRSARTKKPDITIILDNTWAAGILLNAFDLGVDISLQSGTKYLTGHSDIMLGTAVSNDRCWEQLRDQSYLMGQIVDADTAYMAIRGLRTLHIRLKQHEQNAVYIANWLLQHSAVMTVNHPALPHFKGHDIFMRDFSGSNGLFSFVLKRKLTDEQLSCYLDHFKYFRIAYSWGGYESLILAVQPEDLKIFRPFNNIDYTGTIIRLHVGLEDVEDLIDDLNRGFDRINN